MLPIGISESLERLAREFQKAGAALYVVGGAVRSAYLGLPPHDMDICSRLPIKEVAELCKKAGFTSREKGAFFGTLDIVKDGESYEYAAFRSESYAQGGAHRPSNVLPATTVGEDAVRRDFTANALYYDILSREVIDPTGGIIDIERKVIRATSKDPRTIMADDGIRILRMARFAAELGFTVDAATLEAARESASGLLDISPERLREELDRLLMADVRYGAGKESLFYGLETLYNADAFKYILPELQACEGIAQRREYHAYDVLYHSLHAVEECEPRLMLRLAMLLHDTGKPVALKSHGNMHGHETLGADIACGVLARLRYPNSVREHVTFLVRWHMYDLRGNARERTLKKRFVSFGRDIAMELPYIREADVHGSGIIEGEVTSAARWREVISRLDETGAPWTEAELDCTGEDICEWLSIPPSKRVGEVKRALLMHCCCKPSDNRREKLRLLALDIGSRS